MPEESKIDPATDDCESGDGLPMQLRHLGDQGVPAKWLQVRPARPVGKLREIHSLAWLFTNRERLAWRADYEKWMRLLQTDKDPDDWHWVEQREEMIRLLCFAFLQGVFVGHSLIGKRRSSHPDYFAKLADGLLKEAKRLPFRVGIREENQCLPWVTKNIRPSRELGRSRGYRVSNYWLYKLFRMRNPDYTKSENELQHEMQGAIRIAFRDESTVKVNYHVTYRDEDGRIHGHQRGYTGLMWVNPSDDRIAGDLDS
jgi:hypothetical protein